MTQPIIINTTNGPIEVRIEGVGTPILFVHGGHVDCRETIFQKGFDHKEFQFIAVSRPGYGNTPLTESNKTSRGTADLIVALLDELKVVKVILVGISAGGLTSLEIASNYPERVDKLLLLSALTKKWFDASDFTYRGAKWIFGKRIQSTTWSIYRGLFNVFPRATAKMMFRQVSSFKPVTVTDDELFEVKGMTMHMNSGEGFVNDLDQDINQAILLRIQCPTLIIHSHHDNAVHISHAENAQRKIKTATLTVADNRWGHLLWIGPEYQHVIGNINAHLRS